MERRPVGLRRLGFVMALLVSAATFAYSLTGIVSAGDDLRSARATQAKERQAPVSYERCRERRDERVRL
jgi:hypothetical protein